MKSHRLQFLLIMYLKSVVFIVLVAGCFSASFRIVNINARAQSEEARLKTLMNAFLKWFAEFDSQNLNHGHFIGENEKNSLIKVEGVNLFITYLNFEKAQSTKAVVDYLRICPKTLAVSFKLRCPSLSETDKYKINGKVFGHKIHGEGEFTYSAKNLSYSISDLKFLDKPHNLQIISMRLKLHIEDLKIKFTKLHVEGMKLEAFEKLVESKVVKLMNEKLSDFPVGSLIAQVNKLMHNKSLEEMVKWLENHKKDISFKYALDKLHS
ncbi:hypothetical protein GE061_017948 [Apolygus lucorum]|uniref:Uncharacterized protein n=1 Tax=Apolygus lucorum TaxID=248454 RepID=A0A8S9XCF4_APOLU|nr:hypothetical protein GE061_017948 [Apolygus lucorum]